MADIHLFKNPAYKLPNGTVFNTEAELKAYRQGIKDALSALDASVTTMLYNSYKVVRESEDGSGNSGL